MAETHVVSALVDKYAELSGLILDYQKKIDQMRVAVGHLDASIKLFAPDYDLRSIRCKVPMRPRNQFFRQGEVSRMALDILRETGEALSSRQLAEIMIGRKSADMTVEMIEQFQRNVLPCLNRLEKAGTLIPAGKDGNALTWRIA